MDSPGQNGEVIAISLLDGHALRWVIETIEKKIVGSFHQWVIEFASSRPAYFQSDILG
jgi:hypothetical protein